MRRKAHCIDINPCGIFDMCFALDMSCGLDMRCKREGD